MEFIKLKSYEIKFIIEIDNSFIHTFLDYLYVEKGYSTNNNCLQFLNTFFNLCESKGYIKQNPAELIMPKPKKKQVGELLRGQEKKKLIKLLESNFHYYALCMCTNICFIRKTELTKLRVSDVNIDLAVVTISEEQSKNKSQIK